MKKIAFLLLALQFSLLTAAHAAPAAKECAVCVGAVSDLTAAPVAPLPLLVRLRQDDLATTGAAIDALSPEQRRRLTVLVSYELSTEGDKLLDVEQRTKAIVEWARLHGPFEALGVRAGNADAATAGYAIKRLSVTAQGQNAASRIVVAADATDPLAKLYETGAQTYFAVVLTDAASVAATSKWLAENDPVKKITAVVAPHSPNPLFDLMQAIADGATRAYLDGPLDAKTLTALASADTALVGDYAYDATSKTTVLDAKGNAIEMPVLSFVRGEDLRTLLIPRGDATSAAIVSLSGDQYTKPRRIDAAGEREITDVGRKNGRFLIGALPTTQPYALSVEHSEKLDGNVTKESIEIATKRGITVEEVIRNHQSYDAYQDSIQPRYIANNATKLRFSLQGAEAIEATISGDYFAEPGRADWVWQDFYLNGVKWKYGRIPELPLIQPEKVTQLPLDIHLTNEYRYQLVRETDVDGYHAYEVRFEPPPIAAASLPLYRGTVWIDARTWARIRITMVQLNLTGEVLSNEERVDFQPFSRAAHVPLNAGDVAKADPRELIWLPREVSAQQVVSAAGRANVVLRSTTFSNFRIDTPEFDRLHIAASASDARMVRESAEAGLKYLEKRGDGTRVVKEGFDSSRTFMLGGIHHDAGLQFPVVPLGGIDYFNFNLFGRGIQTNVFFAGVVLAANATNPNVANTRTNIGADFFGIALPTTNSIYRGGNEQKGEAVKTVPLNLTLRAGHPFLGFGKIDVSFGVNHTTYQRAEDTAANFEVPADTFVLNPGLDAQYSRWGYTLTGFYDYAKRTSWRPWGNFAEYSDDQKTYTRFGGSFGKSFYLPKFQRLSVDVNYLDGQRLDRFSKYELGFFGSQRIHGVQSGSVRAERAILAHLSYGFVFSNQFRLEAFYDHGLLDD
ncbi:MAG TPA: hypothetical protein VN605_00920, partial [Thermoanaerobaculia bacterium]|nr:hypothetical protein [Thermoanaerobaculia bacterium]